MKKYLHRLLCQSRRKHNAVYRNAKLKLGPKLEKKIDFRKKKSPPTNLTRRFTSADYRPSLKGID